MADTIYKLQGTVVGTTTDGASIVTIQDDGRIDSVLMSMWATEADALGDRVECELSFVATNTFATNDVRSSIMALGMGQNFLTSGGSSMNIAQHLVVPGGVTVAAGERIHLHGLASSGVTMRFAVYLYTTAGRGRARIARRNR